MVTQLRARLRRRRVLPGHTGFAYLTALYGINDYVEQVPHRQVADIAVAVGTRAGPLPRARNTPLDTEDKPESIAVGYSTSGSEMADFKWLTTVELTGGYWKEVTADLPQGATYFAVRSHEPEGTGFGSSGRLHV